MSESIASASQPHERWRRRAMHSAAAAGARHFTHRAAPRPMLHSLLIHRAAFDWLHGRLR